MLLIDDRRVLCALDILSKGADSSRAALRHERAGWQLLVGTVLVGGTPQAPLQSDELGKVTIGSFFSERARRAAATFAGSRIELYPGDIDKLW